MLSRIRKMLSFSLIILTFVTLYFADANTNFEYETFQNDTQIIPILQPKSVHRNWFFEHKRRRQPKQVTCDCGIRNVNGVTNGKVGETTRIVGGVPTNPGEIKWRVALFITQRGTNSGGICGGTIISSNWVLTAAHCTMNMKPGIHEIKIYVGAQANPITVGYSGTPITADRYIQHPSFNPTTMDNDITLVHVPRPIQFKANVGPVCLPFGNLATANFEGATVLASGWGTTQPVPVNVQNKDPVATTLRMVEIPLLTTAQCQQYIRVTKNQICTYEPGKDTCQGDSGGSIDYKNNNGRYYAVGVVSNGYGCGQARYPGVYTKVNNYLNWIETNTRETFCKPR